MLWPFFRHCTFNRLLPAILALNSDKNYQCRTNIEHNCSQNFWATLKFSFYILLFTANYWFITFQNITNYNNPGHYSYSKTEKQLSVPVFITLVRQFWKFWIWSITCPLKKTSGSSPLRLILRWSVIEFHWSTKIKTIYLAGCRTLKILLPAKSFH